MALPSSRILDTLLKQERVKELARLMAWYPYRWGISLLPPGRELPLTRGVGRLAAHFSEEELAKIARNMARGLPERQDHLALARQWMENRFVNELMALSLEKLDQAALPSYISFEGLANLDAALAAGKGAILTHPHFGPMRLPSFALGLMDYKVAWCSPQRGPDCVSPTSLAIYRAQEHLEARVRAAQVDPHQQLRPKLRRLKEGEVVMVHYDGGGPCQMSGKGVTVRLLGQEVILSTCAVSLGLRGGAPILPMVVLPSKGPAPYKAVISPPMPLEHLDDIRTTLTHNTQRLAAHLEAHIRAFPGCWHLWPDFEPGRKLMGEC